jgi:hypothetical protein
MKRHMPTAATAILALATVLIVAGTLFAQAAPAGKPKAVVVEPIGDVGSVAKGDNATHDFVIKNDGAADLQITNVQPSCGCTVARYDKLIAPGKTGSVHVVVDTTTFTGAIAKSVTVYTNDPENPQIQLTVRAKVEPYIAVKPGYARYLVVRGEPQQGVITQSLWSTDGQSFDITGVDSPMPALKVTYREATEKERQPDSKGKQWKIEMTLSNDQAPVGALTQHVVVHTTHPKEKIVDIPISGFVRPIFAVTPPIADFGKVDLKEPRRFTFNVKNFATEPINVTRVDPTLKGVGAELKPVEAGRNYNVQLTLKPDIAKGPFDGKLMLRTDSPKMPVVEVEFRGVVL